MTLAPGSKPLTRALIEALGEISPETNAQTLRRIVDRLIAKAIDGDLSAIREIFDRIDGKVSADGVGSGEPRKVIFQWKGNQ